MHWYESTISHQPCSVACSPMAAGRGGRKVPFDHCDSGGDPQTESMLKRVLYLSLWFYAGWTLGSFITSAFGVTGVIVLPEFVSPATGVAVAAAVAYDLR